MVDAAYENIVKETFWKKPLRTVLMIDDEYPTFSDIARLGAEEMSVKFPQADRAVRLYDSFRLACMACDVENVPEGVHADRFRTSDLIVLDYNLGAGGSDRSIEILRELSESTHFNTVVVYTSESNLDDVWLQVIASLGGGWKQLPSGLRDEAQQEWDRLSDSGKMPEPNMDAVMAYAKRGSMANVPSTALQEIQDLGVPQAQSADILKSIIYQVLAGKSGSYSEKPARRAVGDAADNVRWIQSGNVFVAIVKKADLSDNAEDPAGIMEGLRQALLAWRPNLIQILVSEIQNILEFEALAAGDEHLRDPVTHTALTYYLLEALGPVDSAGNPDIRAPLSALIDKILEGLRRKLATDPGLLKVGGDALLAEIRSVGWKVDAWPKARSFAVFDNARKLARTEAEASVPDTMFRLNSLSSTERFRRAHITTGTIFRHPQNGDYFVAASPSCDLVPRSPGPDQKWASSIFPVTPLVAVRLTLEDNPTAALKRAADGYYVFLENGSEKKALKTVAGGGDQPSFEFFMVKDKGLVREQAGRTLFDAWRLSVAVDPQSGTTSPTERNWYEGEFEIVGQLRGLNATRLLLLTGQHLSRVGLEFMSTPQGWNGQA